MTSQCKEYKAISQVDYFYECSIASYINKQQENIQDHMLTFKMMEIWSFTWKIKFFSFIYWN